MPQARTAHERLARARGRIGMSSMRSCPARAMAARMSRTVRTRWAHLHTFAAGGVPPRRARSVALSPYGDHVLAERRALVGRDPARHPAPAPRRAGARTASCSCATAPFVVPEPEYLAARVHGLEERRRHELRADRDRRRPARLPRLLEQGRRAPRQGRALHEQRRAVPDARALRRERRRRLRPRARRSSSSRRTTTPRSAASTATTTTASTPTTDGWVVRIVARAHRQPRQLHAADGHAAPTGSPIRRPRSACRCTGARASSSTPSGCGTSSCTTARAPRYALISSFESGPTLEPGSPSQLPSNARHRPFLTERSSSGRMPPMRFGLFMAPFHPTGQNPTLALERDLELIEHLDRLGFDEAWIGEHHSGGYEIIASPEVFIAAAAERTKHIRLGSGVNSLPYHHPLLLADRFVLLDHLTRGRAMLGCGPGQLTSDAHMLGIPADEQRPRMDEALDAIMALLRGEIVTMQTDWFTLQDARLQLQPYSEPNLEVAVAASISPTGAHRRRQARHRPAVDRGDDEAGLRRDRHALEDVERGRRAARPHRRPRASGASSGRCTSPRRRNRRARTSSTASCRSRTTSPTCCRPVRCAATPPQEIIDNVDEDGFAVIGTPDDAIAQDPGARRRVGRLRHVPAVRPRLGDARRDEAQLRAVRAVRDAALHGPARRGPQASCDWVTGSGGEFVDRAANAIMQAIADHAAEQAGELRVCARGQAAGGSCRRRKAAISPNFAARRGRLALGAALRMADMDDLIATGQFSALTRLSTEGAAVVPSAGLARAGVDRPARATRRLLAGADLHARRDRAVPARRDRPRRDRVVPERTVRRTRVQRGAPSSQRSSTTPAAARPARRDRPTDGGTQSDERHDHDDAARDPGARVARSRRDPALLRRPPRFRRRCSRYPAPRSARRDGVQIHFWLTDDADIPKETSCRIDVTGIDALYAEMQTAGVVHPNGPLQEQPWGIEGVRRARSATANLIKFGERVAPRDE